MILHKEIGWWQGHLKGLPLWTGVLGRVRLPALAGKPLDGGLGSRDLRASFSLLLGHFKGRCLELNSKVSQAMHIFKELGEEEATLMNGAREMLLII